MHACYVTSVVSDPWQSYGLQPARLLCPWDPPGKNTGVDCHSLLQRIFPTLQLNLGLLCCKQILYHLSYREDLDTDRVSYKFNSILTLSTLRKCQIPQVKRSVPQDCSHPTSDTHHKSRLLLVLLITDYKLKVPTTPSSGSIHLLEGLAELRKSVYLLDYWFIVKRM